MVFYYRTVFRHVSTARYNVAAWKSDRTGRIMLLSRSVRKAGRAGEPDTGDLIQAEMTLGGKVIRQRTIWKPSKGNPTLEDPRALAYEKNKVLIGFSAIYLENGNYVPYAALTHLDSSDWTRKLPKVHVYRQVGAGKNTTPIDNHTFFFRKEGSKFNHRLEILSYRHRELIQTNHLIFPQDLPWAAWRIGTTMPPVWIDPDKALMVIHGISIKNGLYIYSLGIALLTKNGAYQVVVHPKAIITPDDFVKSDGSPVFPELHPEHRRVVYACGGYLRTHQGQKNLVLLVNVGDTTTIAAHIPISHLLELFS